MGTIHKTVTPAVLAANQANSAASTGPASESGKEQSKMNAFKNGKYAWRPDPVELLLRGYTEEEAAEREELRAEMVRCYQPADDFARLQAQELADLQFELRRLERAQEVVLARERELLALEQRRRALRLREGVEATSREVNERGFVGQPDSPGKFHAMLRVLGTFVEEGRMAKTDDVWILLKRLYGDGERAWRGVRMRWAVADAEKAESDEEQERATQDFLREAKREIELVREELAICELEQGPLSQAGEAARLLEAMGSRKWSWMRQREMFLRRSIDRKVQVLIELRRDANRGQRRTAAGAGAHSTSDQRGGGSATGDGGGTLAGVTADGGEAPAVTPAPSRPEAPAPGTTDDTRSQSEIPRAGEQHGDARSEGAESGRNQRTKPLSVSESLQASKQVPTWASTEGDRPQEMPPLDRSDYALETIWIRASRS